MLSNDLLIRDRAGRLFGAILSYIMCKAMNRSFFSVIAGGFGTDGSLPVAMKKWASTAKSAPKNRGNAEKLALGDHHPGLRHGGAQAQYPVAEITERRLRARQKALWYSSGCRASARHI
jgi:NAD(P) transhydrogenase subunit beta